MPRFRYLHSGLKEKDNVLVLVLLVPVLGLAHALGMTALIGRDSTNPFDIPLEGLAAVMGYGDGLYQWSSEGWARFLPPIVPLSIVINSAHQGDILDIEPGGATPIDAPVWCDRFDRPGRRAPTLYVNRANWSAVRAAVGSRRVDYWVATLDGTLDGTAGAVAVQWKGEALTGGHYDESLILDPTWIGLPGGDAMDPTLATKLDILINVLLSGGDARVVGPWVTTELEAIRAAVTAQAPPGGGLTVVQAKQLADLAAAVARIETALQKA